VTDIDEDRTGVIPPRHPGVKQCAPTGGERPVRFGENSLRTRVVVTARSVDDHDGDANRDDCDPKRRPAGACYKQDSAAEHQDNSKPDEQILHGDLLCLTQHPLARRARCRGLCHSVSADRQDREHGAGLLSDRGMDSAPRDGQHPDAPECPLLALEVADGKVSDSATAAEGTNAPD
jgi:hypothetical protein